MCVVTANPGGVTPTFWTVSAAYACHLCEHLSRVDKQVASRSGQFLDACRSSNKGELPEDKLVQTTVRLRFNNVIDVFHGVDSGPVPVRFFVDERNAGGPPFIRLTDDLRRLATSVQRLRSPGEGAGNWTRRPGSMIPAALAWMLRVSTTICASEMAVAPLKVKVSQVYDHVIRQVLLPRSVPL